MRPNKSRLRKLIRRVVNEDREPLKDILDHEVTADVVHALHSNWAGGEGGSHEAENLVLPIDHSVAGGGEPVTTSQEVIDHTTGKVVSIEDRGLSESQLRSTIRKILLRII